MEWPERLNGVNYPQTEPDRPYPTRVIVSLNGVAVGELALPDDPADARGVLSHLRDIDPGSYGYLREMQVEGEKLAQILGEDSSVLRVRFTVPAGGAGGVRIFGGGLTNNEAAGGLALYGDTLGCYPVDPTILLEM